MFPPVVFMVVDTSGRFHSTYLAALKDSTLLLRDVRDLAGALPPAFSIKIIPRTKRVAEEHPPPEAIEYRRADPRRCRTIS